MNTTTVLPNRKSRRPATGPACDDNTSAVGALNFAGSIASLKVIRIGAKMLAPAVAGAGLMDTVAGAMVSAVVNPATKSAFIAWPTRSLSAATRSEYLVCSFSGASGVNVIVVSPTLSDTTLAMLPEPSDSVTFAPLTVAGSIGSDITTRTVEFFATPVAEGAGTTCPTTGDDASSVMSPRAIAPARVPVLLARPVPIGSSSASR